MSNNILAFKLITGEEVIGEVTHTKFNGGDVVASYVVRRPHVLQFQPVGNGQIRLVLMPWTLSNPEGGEVVIHARSVVCDPFTPGSMAEKQYLQQTSGISLDTKV